MLSYPEKFWKIINYYYNSNKAWYSEKTRKTNTISKTGKPKTQIYRKYVKIYLVFYLGLVCIKILIA